MKGLFIEKAEIEKIKKEEIEEAVFNLLYNISTEKLVKLIYNEFEAIMDYASLCKGKTKIGNKISLLFNPHRLECSTLKSNKSIIEALKDEKYVRALSRVILFQYGNNNNYKNLLQFALAIGTNGIQYVNEFQPYVARDLYKDFNAKKILDPCAGWGARMIGASCLENTYYQAYEPSVKTYNGLLRLGEFLQKFKPNFQFKIENIPYEEAKVEGKFDVALTSPPYYDTEHYADEKTQSFIKYKSFENWCDGFYYPMIDKTLVHTNNFILNVADRNYPLSQKIYDKYKNVKRIKDHLNNTNGLNKGFDKGEKFYLIHKNI